MKYIPVPGVILIEPYIENSAVQTRTKAPSQLIQGKVIAVGDDYVTDYGTLLEADKYAKVGDEVIFLSYQGKDYDTVWIDNKEYYAILFKDMRLRHG